MRRTWGVLVTLVFVAFAGCAGDNGNGAEGATREAPGADGVDGRIEVPLPNWTVGDWWAYRGIGDLDGLEFPYVVTEDLGSDWFLDTTDLDFAFWNAQDDISFLGKTRKSDLAGSQGDVRVKYFDFPLFDGKNWTTDWDGLDLKVTAFEEEDSSFRFEAARPNGVPYVTYGYSPDVRWFTLIEFRDENGTVLGGGRLTSSGSGFSGEVVRWKLETVKEGAWDEPVGQPVNPFDVADTVTDLWLSYTVECETANGGYNIVVKPVNPAPAHAQKAAEQGYAVNEQCAPDVAFEGVIQEDPVAGGWNALLNWGEQGTPSSTFLLLKRTLEAMPVGG